MTATLVQREIKRRVAKRELARRHFLNMVLLTPPAQPYMIGRHTDEIAKTLEGVSHDVKRGRCRYVVINLPPRHGKALAVDTPIPTPSGWTTIADLLPGDSVFGADGRPCLVIGKSETWKDRPVYAVGTDDGDQIVADAEHLWKVRLCRKHKRKSLRTTEWLANRTSPRRPTVRNRYITVEPCGRADTVCIQVDSDDGMFLCGRTMIPTHNSDLASRRFPAWHLADNPKHEIILTGYSGELATDLAYSARACFAEIGPWYGTGLMQDRQGVAAWRTDQGGAMYAVGLGGSITGRGAHILVVDDYLRNREDAESGTIRKKNWDGFRNDLMTRLAPAHAVVIVATRWHEADLVGRIQREMAENPDFPRFEFITYPAVDEHGTYLFPERFSPQWYERQRALVGKYAWRALYQQEPRPRHGNMLRADRANVVEAKDVPAGLSWRRGWDIASSEKERAKDDPDYTVGTLAAFDRKRDRVYVRHVCRGQWSTLKRNKKIETMAAVDGRGVRVMVEAVGGYVDTFNTVKAALKGRAIVRKVTPTRDKVARASHLEPIFEAGNVYIARGPWNREWIDECNAFPSATHDDQVDSLVVALYRDLTGRGRMSLSGAAA